MMKKTNAVHFDRGGNRAICGANQGAHFRARISTTTDQAKATCTKCLKNLATPGAWTDLYLQQIASK